MFRLPHAEIECCLCRNMGPGLCAVFCCLTLFFLCHLGPLQIVGCVSYNVTRFCSVSFAVVLSLYRGRRARALVRRPSFCLKVSSLVAIAGMKQLSSHGQEKAAIRDRASTPSVFKIPIGSGTPFTTPHVACQRKQPQYPLRDTLIW